jgi:hypothetical protein
MNQAKTHTITKKTRTKTFIDRIRSFTDQDLDLHPMEMSQHTTRGPTK